MKACEATVIIPTTGNRGALLRYSVESVRNQTVQDTEILIVGDGVSEEAREIISGFTQEDRRIVFHDFPKHERRGEPNRHHVIQTSRGRNVFYLTDRDLMLPNHLETLTRILSEHNFVSTTYIDVKKDKSLNIRLTGTYFGSGALVELSRRKVGTLSCIGHTREMYDCLQFGWRTTPADRFTDNYMWEQFMAHPECNPYSSVRPTILYFKRGDYPGDPIEERAKELAFWSERIATPEGINEVWWTAFTGVLMERYNLKASQELPVKRQDRSVSKS